MRTGIAVEEVGRQITYSSLTLPRFFALSVCPRSRPGRDALYRDRTAGPVS